ncbi:hypothetical protein PSTG_03735 [Puccinia striiformis f. sp. tritici PST-78]|uniref:Uncharacterized protein n=1 Tax=Puccinia striiformis f. sp. tritici PST-78 TaxID=1165861 RepID=A0A0L0VV45_9BASI|nr:hypothetical protein PSTG_03735 [Puccinia striiformis f. sp. tritici PST-78]
MSLPDKNQKSKQDSAAAGGSNSVLNNHSAQNRLAEDIAILQANAAPPHMDSRLPANSTTHNNNPVRNQTRMEPTPQEAADVALAKEMRDFETAEFYLKQQKLVHSAIQSGKSLIQQVNILEPDGSNFGKWYANLQEIGRAIMANSTFFFNTCSNLTYEKIGCNIILASIHESLVPKIQAINTCFMMYARLMMKFKTPSRASQMKTWYKFRSFKIDPAGHNTGIASDLRDLHHEWIAINVVFNPDVFQGFVLQAAVMDSGAPYREAFDFEQLVQANEARGCPPFNDIMRALDICKEQHRNAVAISLPSSGFTSSLPPMALASTIPDHEIFDATTFLAEIDQDDKNHYTRNCPDKSRAGTASRPMGQPLGTLVGTIYGHLPSGFQVNSSRFPKMQQRKTLTPPSQHQEHARNLADYYHPWYSQGQPQQDQQSTSVTPQASRQGGVSAHKVEVNCFPDNLDGLGFHTMALGEDILPMEQGLISPELGA